jgi:hypothetical protein
MRMHLVRKCKGGVKIMRLEVKMARLTSLILVAVIAAPIGLVAAFSSPETIIFTNSPVYKRGDEVVIRVVLQNPSMNRVDLTIGAAFLEIRYAFNDTVVYAPPICAVTKKLTLMPLSSMLYEKTVWSQTVGWSKNASSVDAPNLFIASMKFYSTPSLGEVSAGFIIM